MIRKIDFFLKWLLILIISIVIILFLYDRIDLQYGRYNCWSSTDSSEIAGCVKGMRYDDMKNIEYLHDRIKYINKGEVLIEYWILVSKYGNLEENRKEIKKKIEKCKLIDEKCLTLYKSFYPEETNLYNIYIEYLKNKDICKESSISGYYLELNNKLNKENIYLSGMKKCEWFNLFNIIKK